MNVNNLNTKSTGLLFFDLLNITLNHPAKTRAEEERLFSLNV